MLVKTREQVLGWKSRMYGHLGLTWVPGHGPKYFPQAIRLRDITDGDIDNFLRQHYRDAKGREYMRTFALGLEQRKREYRERRSAHDIGEVATHIYAPPKLLQALEHDFPADFKRAEGVSEDRRRRNLERVLWRFVVCS